MSTRKTDRLAASPPSGTSLRPGSQSRGGARRSSLFVRAALRPETSAAIGVVVVFAYFGVTAGGSGFLTTASTQSYLQVASLIGILTCAVALLMIAGEFDLSVGSMTGAGGIAVAYPVVYHGWPLWLALLLGFAIACGVGLLQGVVIMKTRLPSFIVTLAGLFVIAGLTLAITKLLTNATTVDGIEAAAKGDPILPLLSGSVDGVPASVIWWLGLTLLAMYVLNRTRFGNWMYACGGDAESARRSGVPVSRVKVLLFVGTALAATFVGVLSIFTIDSASVTTGTGYEFQTITAAVIGGTLLTGGFGSPIGAALGALIFGMVNQGFFFTDIEGNWFQVFLGAMLLIAVLVNHYARLYALRRGAS
ncbi:MAG TPA: ABC transporter permease [Conexibacter sp.]|nr:ABC transporter permease [Conexibacter sp.]